MTSSSEAWITKDPALIDAGLIASASAVWLLFTGPNVQWLSLGYVCLLVWFVRIFWRSYSSGFSIPHHPVGWVLLLYLAWLAATLLWSPVTYISTVLAWWLGVMPIVYWAYMLSPNQDKLWRYIVSVLTAIAACLAIYGLYEWWGKGRIPRGPFIDQNLFATTLNIVALIVAGQYLRVRNEGGAGVRLATLLAVVFLLLVHASAATKGRGPLLALLGGLLLMAIASWPHIRKRACYELAALVALAVMLANIVWHGAVTERLGTLVTPYVAGASRFVIWRQSWSMLMDHPWFGIGLGIYPLRWPAYRDFSDASAGYFVHNDYLNIWIEAGLPGLILFLTIWLVLAWRVIAALRRADLAGSNKIEIAALSAALATVAAHSLLEFNFYVVTTLLLCGLIIGRLTTLTAPAHGRVSTVVPSRFLGRPAYRMLTLLILLFPALYFARIGIASVETDRGLAFERRGELPAAEQAMTRALKLWPESDAVHESLADLYRSLLVANPTAPEAQRKQAFGRAMALLDQAVAINPLRGQNYGVRAELIRQNPQFIDDAARAEALVDVNYAQALRYDPLYVFARVRYADFLLKRNERERAREILESGLPYRYPPHAMLVSYYLLAAQVREQYGDSAGSRVLLERAKAVKAWLPASS